MPTGRPLPARSTRAEPDRRKPSRRRRLLIPAVVIVVVLAGAVVASYLWTAHYIHTAISGLQTTPPVAPTPNPNGAAAANQAALLAQVHGSVWAVSTLDGNGNPAVGSAFAVVSTSTQTLLLTSYAVVAAATYQTAPPVQIHQGGGADQSVTLRTWDAAHDLALLVMDKGNQPVLHGTSGIPPTLGQQVYEVSAAGSPTGAITAGKLTAVAAGALDDDAPHDNPSRGGPVIDTNGDALGMASSAYVSPQPDTNSTAHASVPIQAACRQVLVCPGGSFP
ncbi:MAG: serine protease [Actinomycetota bacterium]|nr:serine protease [Actinomycetota bacterium]